MKNEPDMVWLVAQIREQFPAVVIDDPSPSKDSGWLVDMQLGDRRVVVQWTKGNGYSVSLVRDHEQYKTYDRAATTLLRVQQLFARRTVKRESDVRLGAVRSPSNRDRTYP